MAPSLPPPPEVELPFDYTVRVVGADVVIWERRWAWETVATAGAAVMPVAMLVHMLLFSLTRSVHQVGWLLLIVAAVQGWIMAKALKAMRREVRVGHGSLQVRSLPFFGAVPQTLRRREIDRLAIVPAGTRYDVNAILTDGEAVNLFTRLPEEAHAEMLMALMDERLGLAGDIAARDVAL